jgi:tetratricopeptide (TPR) repeat protein
VGLIALAIAALMVPQALVRFSSVRNVFWARLVVDGAIPLPDTQKAIQSVRKAKSAVPGEGEYDFLLAKYLLFIEGDPNSAIAQIRESRKTCDNPDLYLLEARAQIERKNFDAAEPLLSFMEDLDPDAAGLHYMKGEVYRERGRWNDACASFLAEINRYRASGLPPGRDVESSYILLATILEERLGQFSEAAKYYQDYLDLQDDTVEDYPHAQLRLGAMFRDRFFDLDRAEEYFRDALAAMERLGLSKDVETVRKEIAQIEERRMKYQLGL